ncbi:MAG: hypothetical protein LUP98_07410 [Methylococcaceae bacterium]|nr:hypothetical protein [Methylococcaceae bacterium]
MNSPASSATFQKNNYQDDLDAAQKAVMNKDFSSAENYFRKALMQQKNSAIALAGLGQSLCQLNRPNEGIPFLDKAGKVLLKEAKLTRETKYPLDLAYQLVHWHAPKEAFQRSVDFGQCHSGH